VVFKEGNIFVIIFSEEMEFSGELVPSRCLRKFACDAPLATSLPPEELIALARILDADLAAAVSAGG